MAKKGRTTEWYSLDRILGYNLNTNLVIGMRSNGKTYSVKQKIIQTIHNGEKFVYVRREHRHIARQKMAVLFDDIKQECIEYLGSEIFYHAERGFYILGENGEEINVGYACSVEDSFSYKGIPYANVHLILFDEFMDYSYFSDETSRFINLISTLTRDAVTKNYKCILFMLANTITKFCPYLDLYQFDIKKLKPGNFAVVHHKNGVSAVLEYCKIKVEIEGRQPSNPFVGFDDNETVKMVLFGEWETKEYEIDNIDGIGWSCKDRIPIPVYITANGNVYELSLKCTGIPIAFVRQINTQLGKVRKEIRYNISLDDSVILISKNGIVPKLNNFSDFIDDSTKEKMEILNECIRSGRIIFDNLLHATEFMIAYKEIGKK